MGLQRRLNELVDRVLGARARRQLPRGVNFAADVQALLPGYEITSTFDVGAHAGTSALQFARWFPAARIWCFEPANDSRAQLEQRVGKVPHIHCSPLALGASRGEGTLLLRESSLMNCLVEHGDLASPGLSTQAVDIDTVDNFCAHAGIDAINFLKIDTEGHDLAVLEGAPTLLARERIDLLQVEVSMNPTNTAHVPFEEIKSFLERRRYFVFAIYEQVHEWPTGAPHLRRSDVVFISRTIIERYTPRGTVS